MAFLMNTSETKKFVKIFCEAFLIFKKYLALTRTYFHFYKRGFLNSQAVRIRVNALQTIFATYAGRPEGASSHSNRQKLLALVT
jgi:hypothetical protein